MVREARAITDRMVKEIHGRIGMVRTRKMDRIHSSAKAVDAPIRHRTVPVRAALSSAQATIDLRVVELLVSQMVLEARV